MTNLFGLTLQQLQQLCSEQGLPRYTARQICDWLYVKRIDSIDQMTNLSLAARRRLSDCVMLRHTLPVDCQTSKDGTKKYLFSADGLHPVEAVFIPETSNAQPTPQPRQLSTEGRRPPVEPTLNSQLSTFNSQLSIFNSQLSRATLCVSCQRGCKMGCRFCVTGQQGFHGNLGVDDIMSQVLCIPEAEQLTNIVFMGMGEPMDNLDNILAATEILTADWGLGWSPKRITVSTVGITPVMRRFLDESRCHLAVSLHNPFGDERQQLMPMEKAYPIADTIELLRQYDWSGQRRVSFEYIMFDGLNDSRRHADGLLRLLRGLPCRINLIRFHTSPDMPYRTSSDATIQQFRDYLNSHGITCTLRASRGEDIMAACGLLAGKGL